MFYELFVRSFYDSDGNGKGDFKGITEKLDYLNDGDPTTDTDLGITGIWLMPINESPSYHGYDVINYRSVESDYGTMSDFQEFLTEAHNRGIKVIIDFVMNHSSDQNPWFQQSALNNAQYRDFYRWSTTDPGYSGPWGQDVWHYKSGSYYYGLFWGGMPDLNYANPAVKDSMFAAADFWLRDVGVDGFRLDAVKYIFEEDSKLEDTESTFQFWSEFNQHIKETSPNAFTVGEAWTNTETVLKYVTEDRLDYCFEFDLASNILNAVDNGDAENLAAHMQKVYNLYPHLQYGTFLTNHDQNRVMSVFGGDEQKARTAAALYLTLPGVPYLYYGEEIGMTGVKPEDKYIRTPMQWSIATNAGFSTVSPWIRVNSDYTVKNVAAQQADSTSLLSWYKQLIAIRNQEVALRSGEYIAIESSSSSVMAFWRRDGDDLKLVLVNTSENDQANLSLSILGGVVDPGTYMVKDLLSSNDIHAVDVSSSAQIENLALSAYETKIYTFGYAIIPGTEKETVLADGFRLHQNYPNPFNPNTCITYEIPAAGNVQLNLFDVRGRVKKALVDEYQVAGQYTITFDAEDLAAGVYFYKLVYNKGMSATKKMLLIR
ncbi:MAG: T9SS type A sorting domain-containing protein [Candidatus Marinimicrobia bacterium]|nr:T9SS type A sorting domain-containing protein [Candidatus Neomarinimicrobiota bacterium]